MSALAFELPTRLEATEPPEQRGLRRDGVRLMVADRHDGALFNARFHELPELLDRNDLLVVNVSATLPASVSGQRAGTWCDEPVRVNFSTPAPGKSGERWWVVEVRSADGSAPARGATGEVITLGRGRTARLELVARYAGSERLWVAELHSDDDATVLELLWRLGEPIRYGYVDRRWPLDAYQNVYATTPGSAEMPSAGRPFTAELIAALHSRGIGLAAICLHTGVSSPERHETPFPERYDVSPQTARRVGATRTAGGRVIAVGTTVVRALETVAGDHGIVHAGAGWTNLMIEPDRELGAVDGLITGWHEPEASHLMMLEAIGGAELLERSYAEAVRRGYLWHEFGDSHLILR
ncbi:MAG: S-adenosylmethionine:tRNA ribosyltransferase-isomerase [Solirubrobacteraceae bacterium]